MNEKRSDIRQKSFLRGLVYFENCPSALDCLIRDISQTGARLKFSSPPMGTDILTLTIPVKNQSHRATVQWRAHDEIGIAFTDAARTETASSCVLTERMNRLEAEIAVLKQMIKKLQKSASGSTEAA